MIKRIVKLPLMPGKVLDFIQKFKDAKPSILASKGCRHLELLRDTEDDNLFFTFSIWDSEADLTSYRDSAIFMKIWEEVKPMFNGEPQAWTLQNPG